MMTVKNLDSGLSLGALVAEQPARARPFEQLRLDYCCGAFPRIGRQLETVVRVHGDGDPRLHQIQRVFNEARSDLEPHLASEEGELFPACIAWEQQGTAVDEAAIAEHEREHTALGHALAALRLLCHDYDRTAAHCNTHRALMDALEAFEQDLHRHVHEENNILLARVREPAETTAEPRDGLLPCCEGWIAEQTHRWATHRG